MAEKKLIGWKAIAGSLRRIAGICRVTAQTRAKKYGIQLPVHYDGGRVWAFEKDLRTWWARVEAKADAEWEKRKRQCISKEFH